MQFKKHHQTNNLIRHDAVFKYCSTAEMLSWILTWGISRISALRSKKRAPFYFWITVKNWPILIIFDMKSYRFFHLTCQVQPLYLGKSKNHFSTVLFIHTHKHQFNSPLSGTTQVSRYQKGKTNVNFTQARDSEWQWKSTGPYANNLHLTPDR